MENIMRKNLKKTTALLICVLTLATSCNSENNKNNENKNDNNNSKPNHTQNKSIHKLTEYYENTIYDNNEYIQIQDISFINNEHHIIGLKNNIDTDNKISIFNSKTKEINSFVVNFEYGLISDIYIDDNDTAYILEDEQVSVIDLKTGKLKSEHDVKYGSHIINFNNNILIFTSHTIELYDNEFNHKSTINVKEKLEGDMYISDVAVDDNKLYTWGYDNTTYEMYVNIFDESLTLINTYNYNDMPGYTYDIFIDGDEFILTSCDEEKAYIDVINKSDGSVKDFYEVPNAQFLYYGYKENEVIAALLDTVFAYNYKTKTKTEVIEPELESGKLFYSDGYIISLPESSYCLETMYTDKENTISLGDTIACGITTDGTPFGLYNTQDNQKEIKFLDIQNSDEKTIELFSEDCIIGTVIECTEDRIYASAIDEENNIFLITYDKNGEFLNKLNMNGGQYLSKIISSDNETFILTEENMNYYIYSVNKDGDTLLPVLETTLIENIYTGDDKYDFYFCSGSVIYGYDHETKNKTRILNLIDSSILGVPTLFAKADENSYICDDINSEYRLLKKVDDATLEKLNSRKIIYIAGNNFAYNTELSEEIAEFNKKSTDCYIVCKDYSSDIDTTKNSYFSALYEDIINGDIPDIFVLGNGFNAKLLAKTELFADINEFMDKSVSETVFDKSLEQFTFNDRLYAVSPSFTLKGIISSDDNIISKNNYTFEEFLDIAESKKLGFYNGSFDVLYDYFVLSHVDDFIDYKEGKCYFDSELFIRLIKYLKNSLSYEPVLAVESIYDFNDFENKTATYGENFIFFDVSKDGESHGIISPVNSFAISSVSENADIAWKFVNEYLGDEYQSKIENIFPSSKQHFENIFKNSQSTLNGTSAFYMNIKGEFNDDYVIDISESDKETITSIIENSSGSQADDNITMIIIEHMYMYIDDILTAEETAKELQRIVTLYMQEIK